MKFGLELRMLLPKFPGSLELKSQSKPENQSAKQTYLLVACVGWHKQQLGAGFAWVGPSLWKMQSPRLSIWLGTD
jgi:hypothetical protein